MQQIHQIFKQSECIHVYDSVMIYLLKVELCGQQNVYKH